MNLLYKYPKQSVVEIVRLAVICSAIVLALCGSGLSADAAEVRSKNSRRTFADWRREKDSLSPEAKHTVALDFDPQSP
ncbi:MAG: hypothetical protein HC941_30615 [Microcoleus sp. SU_5_3]|nr:hypothetical protein [Microcoleus sp. SU_5_3]NJL67401.1 hypothetical protein [Microcoleus sp. SM1_3_4]